MTEPTEKTETSERQAQARPLTYLQASSSDWNLVTCRERYDELTVREMDARLAARLPAEGMYDPATHDVLDKEPLTAAEHLELIAVG
jgi:hypothetical protein